MTSLHVVVDPAIARHPGEVGRYTLELTRELIRTAPDGVAVAGIVSASPAASYEKLAAELPGLAGLQKSSLDRTSLQALWRRGLGSSRYGMVHATDLLAPLHRHDRSSEPGEQTVVTVHDTLSWTSPESLPKQEVSWRRAMIRRAERYADAIVVPNHAVADGLAEIGAFGDRIRVITGGASSDLSPPSDSYDRAHRLGLPERYLLARHAAGAERGLRALFKALSRTDGPTLPVVVLGGAGTEALAAETGLEPRRVVVLDPENSDDLATVLHRAAVFVQPGPVRGFGLGVLDALNAGVPVVHVDDPALEELTADAALVVDRSDVSGYTASLAQHLDALLDDTQTLERLRVSGVDRAGLFTWRDAAEKVWQLHADL